MISLMSERGFSLEDLYYLMNILFVTIVLIYYLISPCPSNPVISSQFVIASAYFFEPSVAEDPSGATGCTTQWNKQPIHSYEIITTVTHKQLFIEVHVHTQKSP